MSENNTHEKRSKGRHRPAITKKWDHNDEAAIINYIKQNREFEKPTQQKYYTKFITENGLDDINWKLVYYKVRNMRTVYRKAKEYQKQRGDVNEMDVEAVRNVMLKICWYVEDFDVLFPNEMSNILSNPDNEDETSNQKLFSNTTNHVNNTSNIGFNKGFLHEEPILSYIPRSIKKDILAVQRGKFNFKKRKFEKINKIKQMKFELAKNRFEFEVEKFRLETKLKEREIESEEKLKLMELEMKERIAMKELAFKEKFAMENTRYPDIQYSFKNIFEL